MNFFAKKNSESCERKVCELLGCPDESAFINVAIERGLERVESEFHCRPPNAQTTALQLFSETESTRFWHRSLKDQSELLEAHTTANSAAEEVKSLWPLARHHRTPWLHHLHHKRAHLSPESTTPARRKSSLIATLNPFSRDKRALESAKRAVNTLTRALCGDSLDATPSPPHVPQRTVMLSVASNVVDIPLERACLWVDVFPFLQRFCSMVVISRPGKHCSSKIWEFKFFFLRKEVSKCGTLP